MSVFFKTLHGHFNYLLKIYELSYRSLANNCAALKIVKKKKKERKKDRVSFWNVEKYFFNSFFIMGTALLWKFPRKYSCDNLVSRFSTIIHVISFIDVDFVLLFFLSSFFALLTIVTWLLSFIERKKKKKFIPREKGQPTQFTVNAVHLTSY